jgi:nucleotide-binding universal stress UspA family protein
MATRVLRERKCPVLIAGNMCYDAYRNIVLALDGTKVSTDALRVAEAWFVKDGVRATIVNAYLPPYDGALSSIGIAGDVVTRYSVDGTYDASGVLRALLMDVSNDFSRYDLVVENSSPEAIIQKVVHRVNPDLLVLGTHGRVRLGRTLLGSVANRVMATAICDVLVVPERFAEAAGDAARFPDSGRKPREVEGRDREELRELVERFWQRNAR